MWQQVAKQVAADGCTLDARELLWLEMAAAERDQLAKVEAELAKAPLVVKGSMGQPVANSLLAEATRGRQVIASLLARLGLDDPALAVGRGGRTTGPQARAAAYSRHRRVG